MLDLFGIYKVKYIPCGYTSYLLVKILETMQKILIIFLQKSLILSRYKLYIINRISWNRSIYLVISLLINI